MDQVHVIRDKVLREGQSMRRVAREFGVSRNTVAKYLEAKPDSPRYRSEGRRSLVMEAMAPRMQALVDDWASRTTQKQRMTGSRLHEALLADGFDVGVTTVRVWLREQKRQRQEVFVPLVHGPGDSAQVDFFEVQADIAGVRQKAWMLVVHLMHSGRDFAWLYAHGDQVSFLDGHVRAFAHFGGVPRRMVYDNLKAAVTKILVGDRELSPRFEAMAAHYVFEPCFARPYTGHDKGGVESRGRGIRLQHLTPIPQAVTLVAASEALLVRLDAQAQSSKKMEKFADEQQLMMPVLRGDFDPRKLEMVPVDRTSRVRVAGARYAVPTRWAGLDVQARVGVDEIELQHRGESVIAPRQPEGGEWKNWRFYLPELRKKPQAVRQIMPELLEQLGAPFGQLWRLLVDIHAPLDAARVFARLLGAIEEHGETAVRASITSAIALDRLELLLLLPRRRDERPSAVAVPEALGHCDVEPRHAAAYDIFLKGDKS